MDQPIVPPLYDPIPFDDTYILYDGESLISYLCVYFSLLPITILSFYLSWFLLTMEIEPCLIVVGQVVNNVINHVIKNYLKHERPIGLYESLKWPALRNEYGMPSAHSQFMAFMAMYGGLRLILNKKTNKSAKIWMFRILGACSLFVCAFLTAFSRVYLMYHYVDQVVIGVLLGMIVGTIYFTIVCFIRDVGLIDYILLWPICRWFYLKDSYFIEYDCEEEYNNYLQRKEAMKKKKLK